MRIKTRLRSLAFQTFAPSMAALLFLLAAFSYSGWMTSKKFANLQLDLSTTTRAAQTLLEIARLRGEIKEELMLYRESRDTRHLAELNQMEFEKSLQSIRLQQAILSTEAGQLLEAFLNANRDILPVRNSLLEAISAKNESEIERVFATFDGFNGVIDAQLADLNAMIQGRLAASETELKVFIQRLPLSILILALIMGAAAIVMMAVYRRRILQPLALLHQGLGAVSAGRLGEALPMCQTATEINDMLHDFNKMTTTLDQVSKELKTAQIQATAATKAKSQFLANMSHEIRTPLNVIIGIADLLQERQVDQRANEQMKILRRSGVLLLNVVNNVLDYSRIEAGHLKAFPEKFDLLEMLNGIAGMMEPLARVKHLSCELRLDAALPRFIDSDRQLLEQALLNLGNNAIKFTEHGHCTLVAKAKPHGNNQVMLELGVSDSGIGIAPASLEKVFARFEQADSSIAKNYGGTGLGLAIVKQISSLLGGTVSVTSTVGKGSYFFVKIPVRVANEIPVAKAAAAQPVRPSSTGRLPSILTVDDSEDNRALIDYYFEGLPFKLSFAENGRRALEMVRDSRFDLVLMDVQMPEMDGHEATREIRRLEAKTGRPSTPIIALSAFADKESVERSLEAGCDSHLSKPIRRSDLFAEMNRYIEVSTLTKGFESAL